MSQSQKLTVLFIALLFMVAGIFCVRWVLRHAGDDDLGSCQGMFRSIDSSAVEAMVAANVTSRSASKGDFAYNHTVYPRVYPNYDKGRGKTSPVEVNSADSVALISIKGIGPAFAHRILVYRERLGGFRTLDQLSEIRGLEDPQRLGPIIAQLSIDSSLVRPLDLVGDPVDRIRQHPYVTTSMYRRIIKARSAGTPMDVVLLPSELATLSH